MNDTTYIWIILLAISLLTWAFLPRVGLLAVWRRWRAAAAREQAEDALKLLLDRSWERQTAHASTLKAGLNLSDRATLALVNRLTAQGWIRVHENGLALTPEGERLAVQITRAHRLLERYLADEARMPLDQVHKEAHRREHQVSPAQVDELDARLGYPSSDPHGDPIPSRDGLAAHAPTRPLTEWAAGEIGRVVHIEDEPALAFAQIQAEGIHPGQTLRVVAATPERYLLTDGQNEFRLAPAIAGNIALERVEALTERAGWIPLTQLKSRQRAEIMQLDPACQGYTRRRFLDLGLTPGTSIAPELPNAFGDPRAYRVRGTLIALRKDQSNQIWVRLPAATTDADTAEKEPTHANA